MSQQTPSSPPSSPPPGPSPDAPNTGNRFFSWMRSLDLPRRPGWIGGVCAGIAARLGIDPLIVRGIAVVLAVLGAPALLLYGVAWLLLPDENNKIHLEEVTRGRFEAPLAGIGVIFFLSLLPITEGFWFLGAEYWGAPGWTDSFGRAVWTLLLFAAIIGFVIWLARRSDSGTPPAGTAAPGTAFPAPGTSSGDTSATGTSSATTPPTYADTIPAASFAAAPGANGTPLAPATDGTAATTPIAPASGTTDAPQLTPPPGVGAPPEEVAAWRERQAQWKAEHDAFRRQQAADKQAAARAAHEQARAEREVRYAADRAARARTRSHPLYSFIVIGLALVAGALVTLANAGSVIEIPDLGLGLAVTLAVLAVSIVINGVRGKRSGGASGFAFVVLFAMFIVAIYPQGTNVRYGGDILYEPTALVGTDSQTFVAGFGDVTMDLTGFYTDSDRQGDATGTSDSVELIVGAADVTVLVPDDTYVALSTDVGSGEVVAVDADGTRTDVYFGGSNFLNQHDEQGGWDGEEPYLNLSVRLGAGTITLVEAPEGSAR